jgi:hypothetical protein
MHRALTHAPPAQPCGQAKSTVAKVHTAAPPQVPGRTNARKVASSTQTAPGASSQKMPAHGASTHAPATQPLAQGVSSERNSQAVSSHARSREVTRVAPSLQVDAGAVHRAAQLVIWPMSPRR